DLHTHLREPGKEEAETIATGTAAAAKGGYTTVFCMANLSPVTDTPERVGTIVDIAARDARARVIPVGSLTQGLAGEQLADIAGMYRAHGTRMFSDDGRCVMNAQLMREALEQVAHFDGFVAQHSQDHNLAPAEAVVHESQISRDLGLVGWPTEAESIIIARDVQLAKLTGARLHVCHLSTAESVEIVRWAKRQGIRVTAEATPHHLYLTTERLRSLDPVFKVNPPLRTDEHVAAVREGVLDGTIDVIGTDHAPHPAADKCRPLSSAAFGMINIEQALGVVMDVFVNPGMLDWADVARIMSNTPRAIGGLEVGDPLAPGARADVVLIDPQARAAVDPDHSLSKSRNCPFAGIDLPDPVVLTIAAGHITYRR
ncbi:MAG: dihydroorotase, partial [Propionibacteriaceae bacterium]